VTIKPPAPYPPATANGHGDSLFAGLESRLPVMLCAWNPRQEQFHSNAHMRAVLGWTEAELSGPDAWERLFPDERERSDAQAFFAVSNRQSRDFACSTRKGGRVEAAWRRIELDNGLCVGIGLEIGDRKRREEQLRRAAESAAAANRAKIELFASVGHEVRNPLNSIMGFAQILESELSDPFHRGCASTIQENGRFLLEIINDLIDVTRIENERLPIRLTAVDPRELVHSVRDMMNILARDKDLPLLVEVRDNPPESILTDPKRLRQILTNLIGNGIKFTSEGSIRVVLRGVPAGDPLPLRIDVIDTGAGIEPDDMERLFEPFFQSPRHSAGGAGLGLTICRKLTTLLGGALTIASEPGRGSTFTLALPVQPDPQAG
jgi:signal transduction histidine kinase